MSLHSGECHCDLRGKQDEQRRLFSHILGQVPVVDGARVVRDYAEIREVAEEAVDLRSRDDTF